ncbi:hypothetical protein EKO29_18070 [Colwellia sp. Arc7-635]|uniref:hypothetical protein n=1 Tax=Colwellia sp. Arc7-635 TaxID=2497879 RepID=UPI000F851468|nr:hypothetical protein [Colwellia sp. Arc7-635]AZQ85734.1 hypothetical protein EKO29_18070 [Colwellia sp. Arc7-635]
MTDSRKQRWQLIRESIKFQIKLTLDAVRDLLLSPVAMIFTVLDLFKGNSKDQGYFQRLMQWGHNTDHWLNLFGDLPENAQSKRDEDKDNTCVDDNITGTEYRSNSADFDTAKVDKSQVDSNLDNLFSKIETIIEEQQQVGDLTASAKQKIADYLALLNSQSNSHSNSNSVQDNKNSRSEISPATFEKKSADNVSESALTSEDK